MSGSPSWSQQGKSLRPNEYEVLAATFTLVPDQHTATWLAVGSTTSTETFTVSDVPIPSLACTVNESGPR